MQRIVLAQGGGPTAVINHSLVGLVRQARQQGVPHIWGAPHGVRGMAEGRFYNLNTLDDAALDAIAATPGAILGSTRDKPDAAYCQTLAAQLQRHQVDGVFYMGGNDTSATLAQIAAHMRPPLCLIHVPKTIDNDLECSDHVPGYGSAARYVALAFMGGNQDQCALPGVHVVAVMGRHAGFLVAASAAARQHAGDGPHMVCLPEVPLDMDKFLARVREVYDAHGRCLIALSEGVRTPGGELWVASLMAQERDAHGNVQLSGSGALADSIAQRIRTTLGIARVRADTLGYPQRSFPGAVSDRDALDAAAAGKYALRRAGEGVQGSVTLNRTTDGSTRLGFVPLADVAGKTRYVPQTYHRPFDVSDAFVTWVRPLLGSTMPHMAPRQFPIIRQGGCAE